MNKFKWFFYSNYCKFIHLFGLHDYTMYERTKQCTWCDHYEWRV